MIAPVARVERILELHASFHGFLGEFRDRLPCAKVVGKFVYAFCVDDGGVDVEADGVGFFQPFRHARHFDLLLLVII